MKGFVILLGLSFVCCEKTNAHSHTYIIEAPATPVYVIAESEPPVALVEEQSACPGPDYVWIKGYWNWNGRWLWTKGNWARRPHPEASWAPGVWVRKPHHWTYISGRWE